MNTTHWQAKALTLFIAAAGLCLTAACADEYTGPKIITPSAPCGPDAPLEPSEEFQQFVGLEHVYDLLRTDRKNRVIGVNYSCRCDNYFCRSETSSIWRCLATPVR